MTKRTRPWGYQDVVDGAQPDWELHPDTIAIRGGLARSGFGETGEALYLTSGFTYDSAEQAESSFMEETAHHLYSRFSNPTVAMFENRLALLEGAEACFATGTGMSAMFSAVACLVKNGDALLPAHRCSPLAT
jgi:O-succinylhomoserine sulfhydrylase